MHGMVMSAPPGFPQNFFGKSQVWMGHYDIFEEKLQYPLSQHLEMVTKNT